MLEDIGKLDLFSLQVFVELMEQHNVTAAALKLNVSQPKVSRTLSILRENFKDELFVRDQHSMKPTKLAESLYQPTMQLVESYKLIAETASYHTKKNREITVACQSHLGEIMLNSLQQTAKELSLDCTFNINPWSEQAQRLLSLSVLDYSIVVNPIDSPKISKHLLFRVNSFYLVANRNHPIFHRELTLNNLLSYPLSLLNYSVTENKKHRIEMLGEKLNIPIQINLKTMDLDLLLTNLETSENISLIGSMLIKQPIANRKTLKAIDVTALFASSKNDIHGYKRPAIGVFLQASELSDDLFTHKLADNLSRKIANLN